MVPDRQLPGLDVLVKKKTIRDLDLSGQRVLLRVDYNVQVEDGFVVDDLRLRESLPTVRALRSAGARVAILSHRGRPRGHVTEEFRNAPVAAHLAKLLGEPVQVIDDCIGPRVEAAVQALQPGELLMLENVRFYAGEETNDDAFAQQLANIADVYVNDAFGTAHRAHASIVGVPRYRPAVAGLLLEREIDFLSRVAEAPTRPMGIVLGGAKVADKIAILEHLIPNADVICVGGAIANTFLAATGIDVADSLVESMGIEPAQRVLADAQARGVRIVLPRDVVVAFGTAQGSSVRTVPADQVPTGWRILDIGPATVHSFREALRDAQTVVWNGPMGLFEREPFDRGTMDVAFLLADIAGTTVVGGGETAAAVRRAGVDGRVTHLSTGGGASLAMLQGKSLPGVEALLDADA